MNPEGYRAPRHHYPTIRQDAYEGTIGLKGDYMRDGATRAQMNRAEAEYQDYNDRIEAAENAGEILDGVITVDWRSNYEGDQAKATLSYRYIDADGYTRRATYESGRTGGGGYNKESTAIANALNKSPEFSRLLMNAREYGVHTDYGVDRNEVKPYPPEYSWGVGVGSIVGVLKQVGIDMSYMSETRSSRTYVLSRNTPLPSESVRSAMGNAYRTGKEVAKKGVARTRQVTSGVKAKAKNVGKTKAPAKKPASASSKSCASKTKTSKPAAMASNSSRSKTAVKTAGRKGAR